MLLIRFCKYESVNIKHIKIFLFFLSFPVIIIIWVAILLDTGYLHDGRADN